MSWLAVAATLAAQQPAAPSWYHAWRLVDGGRVHLGVRPALYVDDEGARGRLELGAGVTVQLTIHLL